MAKFYPQLTAELQHFITQQQLFFTATGVADGRINLSPKGIDSFRIIAPQTVAYLDLTGSGNETSAHLLEHDRITIMFCSFTAKPLILRLYGTGQVIRHRDADWPDWVKLFPSIAGTRQIVKIAVESVQTSCGMGVPTYDFVAQRTSLIEWAEHKGEVGVQQYWAEKNQTSIDGLPTKILG
jgi:Pyridoxamine 5'-phosphate oxidase